MGIGFAPVFVRLSEIGPSATAGFRVLLALPCLWIWMLLERHQQQSPRPRLSRSDWLRMAAAGLLFTGDLALWHWSLLLTSVANSTLFSNLAPVFVTLGAWLIWRERPNRFFYWGMALAFTGGILLVGHSVRFVPEHLHGDALAAGTAIFYAGYLLAVKDLRERFSTPVVMALTGLVSAPSFLLIAWLSQETILPTNLEGWAVVLALALVCHVGGQTLIAYAFGHLPASHSALTLLLQPAVAAVLAWAVLSEPLTPLQMLGGIITLAGVGLSSRRV